MSFRDSGVWVQCLEMNFDFSKFLLQGRSNLGNEVFCHFFFIHNLDGKYGIATCN